MAGGTGRTVTIPHACSEQPVSLRGYWEAVIGGEQRGPLATVFTTGLRLASVAQWAGLHANLAVYRTRMRQRARLGCPVLVVGNLTLGGTGKSTTTVYLVKRLAESGIRAGVVLRGYGRKAGNAPLLVSDGSRVLAAPEEAGDEAVMLAQLLPETPVAVGLRREKAGRLLLREAGVDAVVLDDGFQYFRLHRDADIVLIDASRSIEADRLFPAGTLREPHDHLRRATQVWVTHAELVEHARVGRLQRWLGQHAPGVPIVVAEHRPTEMRALGDQAPPAPGARVIALSALGNPVSFESALVKLGYEVQPLRLADHHWYAERDWDVVRATAMASGAEHVVTTEKDATKLPRPVPEDLAVHVLGCALRIRSGQQVVDDIIGATRSWLGERNTPSAAASSGS